MIGLGGLGVACGSGDAAVTPEVKLGTSGDYAILAKSGVSTVPASTIIGDVGVSPVAGSSITGFSLTADPTSSFSTSPQVTGKVYASDFAPPTPANLASAIADMERAFTDAEGRPANLAELGAGNIGGMSLVPGVYAWSGNLVIPTSVTLAGNAADVWIFQIAHNLTMSGAASVRLTGGALPKNVFWQVEGSVELGAASHIEGVVLCRTSVALETGASINGRLFAQTAVSVDGSTVVAPAP